MDIKQTLSEKFKNIFKTLGYDENLATISFSNKPDICDFQCNAAFTLAKELKINPMEIAKKIADNCNELQDDYEIFAMPPAFVNIKLKNRTISEYANYVLSAENPVKKHEKSLTIILDYGGANVAKELHVGHLRSPIIGESLARLYRLLGHTAITDTHLGDWGLQMGLTIAQLQEDGILDWYFKKSGEKTQITLDMLNIAYPKANKRKNSDSAFMEKAQNYTLFLQQKKQPYFDIWKDIRAVSVEQIKKHYQQLNANFDLWYGESDASDYVPLIIDIFKSKNLARVSSGALVVDIAKEGEHIPMPKKDPDDELEEQKYYNPMPPAIIQKFNGGELYVTTDIATIYERNLHNPFDEIHYVVDKRQSNHFEQVFRCVRIANIIDENKKLLHIGFGTMNGKDGKPFKTREGGIVKLDDVIEMLKAKAKEKLDANGISYDEKLPLQIGVAAMKFGDLSNTVSKDYIFDLDKFTSFEGKTGPYLQYTAVRIKSLLNKSKQNFGEIIIENDEQKNIIISIIKLLESYQQCFNEKSMNSLCETAYNLAGAYSTFYNNTKILTEPDLKKQQSYLSLSKLVLKTLTQALNILAIDIPSKM